MFERWLSQLREPATGLSSPSIQYEDREASASTRIEPKWQPHSVWILQSGSKLDFVIQEYIVVLSNLVERTGTGWDVSCSSNLTVNIDAIYSKIFKVNFPRYSIGK